MHSASGMVGSGPTATIIQVSPKQHIVTSQSGQQFIIAATGGGSASKIMSNEQLVAVSQAQRQHSAMDSIALPSGNQQQQQQQQQQQHITVSAASAQSGYPTVQYVTTDQQLLGAQIEYIEISNGKSVTKSVVSASPGNKISHYQDYASVYGGSVAAGSGTYYQAGSAQLRESVSPHLVTGIVPAGHHLVGGGGSGSYAMPTPEEVASFSHTTRASPVTVQWLLDNYEAAEGVSLPRCTLYNHYLRHCQEHKSDPMNPASFGKLIRSVFYGLKTRRLGTRGNSKYHYYGIRIKPGSTLSQSGSEESSVFRQLRLAQREKLMRQDQSGFSGGGSATSMAVQSASAARGPAAAHSAASAESSAGATSAASVDPEASQHTQFLGDASSALPVFNDILVVDGDSLPSGVTAEDLEAFQDLYTEQCESVLDSVVNLQFQQVETVWMEFWRKAENSSAESKLPKSKLLSLCELPSVQDFVRESDYAFYQSLVEVLIPNVLRPIPSSLTQAIRNFAKQLEPWMRAAMTQVCRPMAELRLRALAALAQTLRRYTSLNHLAQAARAVLGNAAQVSQMLTDLSRVDLTTVHEQAGWVSGCSGAAVDQLQTDFKRLLRDGSSLEQWADWLESAVTSALAPHEDTELLARAARHLLLKWSLYASLVIRDLTLRSAASFGSFHLLRLLHDEYLFYLVEHRVADYLALSPLAVMAEFRLDPAELPDTRGFEAAAAGSTTSTSSDPVAAAAAAAAAAEAAEEPPAIRIKTAGVAVSSSAASAGVASAAPSVASSSAAPLSSVSSTIVGAASTQPRITVSLQPGPAPSSSSSSTFSTPTGRIAIPPSGGSSSAPMLGSADSAKRPKLL
ncbi:hypothetical protein BOX15_Mlig005903g1 [Macrostomum lignano]|uniref:RFX-type winged-helix domain-containing protein n=1 Tax=Macrostomum lignano TaxID=282301 RepID=A0A267E6S8_9PLAT|nr:hypothetical protein BOX15_Mlig005903g1 [Macrostomum lignano]